ncbi:MAG: phospholipase D family protein [Candidatus Korarchaeota archaeon]|nr:phospholipase D family protein [Candidatus Korarchaeota archaeon]
MNKSRGWVLPLILLAAGVVLGYSLRTGESGYGSISSGVDRIIGPFFCPEDHCSSVVIDWISRANESVDLAIYSFTLDSLGDALVRAHQRGVKVRVIMERNQINRWSEYNRLRGAGIEVRLDGNPAYMHNKFMVIDGRVVLTGSYNYTKQADTRNDENLLVVIGEDIAGAYEAEFNEMWSGVFGG